MVSRLTDVNFDRAWIGVVRVTEGDVAALIARNINNARKIKRFNITRYYEIIRNGEWRDDLSIMFDRNGVLLDGQHRLEAMKLAFADGIVSALNVRMETGCDPALRAHLDCHESRLLNERVAFSGLKTSDQSRMAGIIVNTLHRLSRPVCAKPTPKQAEAIFNTNKRAILDVVQAWDSNKSSGYFNAPVCAALVEYVMQHEDRGREFLFEYATESTSDVNASMLQKRILAIRQSGSGSNSEYRYRVTIAACRNHRDGVVGKVLKPASWDSQRSSASRVAAAA